MKKCSKHEDLYIDIGASTKEEAEKLVSVGDYVSFRSDWREFGAGLVKAKALDDRVGCMTLMSLLENDYPCDITCAFTVQEEIGLRGAACVGHNVEADEAIVLEGTTSNDLGDVPSHLRVCRVGAGVAISFMDRASVSCRPVWQKLRDAAEEEGIAWQFKQSVSGGNDAGDDPACARGRAHGRAQRALPQHPFRRQRGRLFRHRGAVPPCRQLSEEAVR